MKRKFLAGIMLLFFALSGAAFTAKKSSQEFHYLQKEGECKQIPVTICDENLPFQCTMNDPDDNTGPWRVNEQQVDEETCETPLFRSTP